MITALYVAYYLHVIVVGVVVSLPPGHAKVPPHAGFRTSAAVLLGAAAETPNYALDQRNAFRSKVRNVVLFNESQSQLLLTWIYDFIISDGFGCQFAQVRSSAQLDFFSVLRQTLVHHQF